MKGTAISDETKQNEVSVIFELLDICDPPAIMGEMPNLEKYYEIPLEGGLEIHLSDVFQVEPYIC